MTRLELLCLLHNQQGGTIFQFNKLYGVDFITMTEIEFDYWWENAPIKKEVTSNDNL